MIKNFQHLIDTVHTYPKKTVVVAAAEDTDVITACIEAFKLNLADFILVGDEEKISKLFADLNFENNFEIYNVIDNHLAAKKSVQLIKEGKANAIMKGFLNTSVFLKALLNKEIGLNRGSSFISHISLYEKGNEEGLRLLTDAAMAIEPDLNTKKLIIENALSLARILGYEMPKVAILSAIETVNPEIKDTFDAAVLSKMAERGQIKNAYIDGPLALDNAISLESAHHKGITGIVAGQADILIVPNLQVGNVLHKSITYIACKDIATAVMGAETPIILTSRTDSVRSKVLTIALACYLSKDIK
jgi:phosphate butyryltransferase